LAIALPEIQFHLVDSIGKKIQVVNTIASEIGLTNLRASHSRVENIDEKFDMAVSRAVAPTKDLMNWMKSKWNKKPYLAFLKGGDLSEELNEALEMNPKIRFKSHSIFKHIPEPFFETKKVVMAF
jgi:16S rRNA (guanine527-N7)-methyltransferase